MENIFNGAVEKNGFLCFNVKVENNNVETVIQKTILNFWIFRLYKKVHSFPLEKISFWSSHKDENQKRELENRLNYYLFKKYINE